MEFDAPRSRLPRWLRILVEIAVGIVVVVVIAWAAGALYYDLPASTISRKVLAIVWTIGALVLWFVVRPRWQARLAVALAFGGILFWWLRLQPQQDRDWKPEVAQLAYAAVDGNRVTIHNVRDFDYRSVNEFTAKWETRNYDLSNLRAVDLFINNWGSELMAHPIISFDFGPDGHLCFSIETRPQNGQGYSAIGGLYRQFELIYIPADERDVIRVRAKYRGNEENYLYRLKLTPQEARQRFLEYIQRLNELHDHPAWYNAVTANCTTSIRAQHPSAERAKWDWRILLNGSLDKMLYDTGMLDQSVPFEELKRLGHINERAREASDSAAFSSRIREGVPGMN
jgi:hypothetical protein